MKRAFAIISGMLFGIFILFVDRVVPEKYLLFVFDVISNSECVDSILELFDSVALKQNIEIWLMVLAAQLIPLFLLSLIAILVVWWTGNIRLVAYSTVVSVAGCLVLASFALRQIKRVEPNLWLAMYRQVSDNSILYVVSASVFLVLLTVLNYFLKKQVVNSHNKSFKRTR